MGSSRLGPEYSSREGIPIRGYIKIVQREGNEQPWQASMTNSAAARSEETSWKISVWILSGNSHAAQPVEWLQEEIKVAVQETLNELCKTARAPLI